MAYRHVFLCHYLMYDSVSLPPEPDPLLFPELSQNFLNSESALEYSSLLPGVSACLLSCSLGVFFDSSRDLLSLAFLASGFSLYN